MKNLEMNLMLAQKSDTSVLIKGVHGIGKSQRAENYAKINDFHCEVLFLSHQETGDLIGIPYLEGGNTIWSKPIWLQNLYDAESRGQKCVLFLDELNRARLDVRQSALQLVLNKQIHQHHLPAGTLVIAAINPEDGDYQVSELDEALKDRFVTFTLKPDAEEWINWAKNNDVNQTVVSFILDNHDKLWLKTENEDNHPTPRSWKKLSDFLHVLEAEKIDKDEKDLIMHSFVCGKIGNTVGNQFITYYRSANDFNVNTVEKALEKIKNRKKENIDVAIKKLAPIIERVEILKLNYVVEELIKQYVPKTVDAKDEDVFEIAYPLMALLYSLPLEVLHSILKSVKDNADMRDLYASLARIDSFAAGKYRSKELFKKIIDKMK
jgi:MoxR-like ATPase